MKKIKRIVSDSRGFSLVELLIVVAIMAIMAGILAPSLIKYIERSRRVKDAQNAQAIEAALIQGFADGTIDIASDRDDREFGVWVMMCRGGDKQYAPSTYHNKNFSGVWYGADRSVMVNGVVSPSDWTYCDELYNYLRDEGLSVDNLRSLASSKNDGWDWIIIQVCIDPSDGRLTSRIYSGFKNEDGGLYRTQLTNIEEFMGRGWE